MPGVATGNIDSAGGTQISQANSWYRINGENIVVIGDAVAGHGEGEHGSPTMAEGESFYRVNGVPVSREGHKATCGDPTTGRDWYRLLSGAYVSANPAQLKARKGTYFYGGAGMDGAYISQFVREMRSAGIEQVKVGNESRWSYQSSSTLIEMLLDASIGVQAFRDSEYLFLPMGVQDYGTIGEQFNLIGYSYGALVVAQIAIKYAREFSGVTDNLVLIGAPISQSFLDELYLEPNIRAIHIIDLQDYEDPIYAGMTYAYLLESIPLLGIQYAQDGGHFYYSKEGADGQARRKQLAELLFYKGLR